MEKDENGKDTDVEVSRQNPPDPVLDLSKWTPYPSAPVEEQKIPDAD